MSDVWLWAERLSWLVAIIGIPSLIIGLTTMVRRPSLTVGFLPLHKSGVISHVERPTQSLDMKLAFTLDPNLSDAITVPFVIRNIGRGTARDLVVNFLFPEQMQLSHISVRTDPQFMVHPGKDRAMWTFPLSHIHPDDATLCPTAMRIPKGLSTVDVDVEISMADAPTMRATVHLVLR